MCPLADGRGSDWLGALSLSKGGSDSVPYSLVFVRLLARPSEEVAVQAWPITHRPPLRSFFLIFLVPGLRVC